jgi:hypothetical protein
MLYTERSKRTERTKRTERRLAVGNNHTTLRVSRQVPLANGRYSIATPIESTLRHFNHILTLVFIFVSVVVFSRALEYTLVMMAVRPLFVAVIIK